MTLTEKSRIEETREIGGTSGSSEYGENESNFLN